MDIAENTAKRIGFALGGLGGFNGHGVGFLQAAKENAINPDMISCTSGMVFWTARFLEKSKPKDYLETLLMQQINMDNRFAPPFELLNLLWLGVAGDPGIFRPAISEYWMRMLSPMKEIGLNQIMDRVMPSQLLVPLRNNEEFSEISEILNQSETGVIFNVFHPRKGKCCLHINEAARKLLDVQTGAPENKYCQITPEAVRAALWLYLYGFEDDPSGIDGAYNRQFIISDLSPCNRIYVVRPQNSSWLGRLPRNMCEILDFNIETWFNSAYTAEVAGIELVNRLIKDNVSLSTKKGKPPAHTIDLIPVQVQHNYSLFEYFVEHKSVYQKSLEMSKQVLIDNERKMTMSSGGAGLP